MYRFLLPILLIGLIGVLPACMANQSSTNETLIQEETTSHLDPITEEEVLEMWKTAVLTERQEDNNWVREWHSVDGRQLAIEFIDLDNYLKNKEYYDTKKLP